jgi:hypothetical protein
MQPKTILSYTAYNNFGKLSTEKVFQVFGIPVLKGSSFVIGSNAWLNQGAGTITLKIWWSESIPHNFEEYYKEYRAAFSNLSFKTNFSILHDGTWYLLNEEPISLFEVDESTGNVLPASTFRLTIDKELLVSDYVPVDNPPEYTPESKSGFIKAELVAPEYGFGATLYANAASETAMENAKGNAVALPQVPYVLLVNKIEIGFNLE